MTKSFIVLNTEFPTFLKRMKELYGKCEVLEEIPISHTRKEVVILFWV